MSSRAPKILPLIAALLFISFAPAQASDCPEADEASTQIADFKKQAETATDSVKKRTAEALLLDAERAHRSAERVCKESERRSVRSEVEKSRCEQKEAEYKKANAQVKGLKQLWRWNGKECANLSDSKDITEGDECNNASVFEDLKGKNCKKAMETVKNVQSRSDALTQASTAGATLYGQSQVTQATGAQDDAQLRQANMMKMLAAAKFLSGAANIVGAGQLKAAASGAEDANSTITSAQQSLAQACSSADDEQACYYQNASKFGLSSDSVAYANMERMKRGAAQSHDQAEAANAAAKASLITGAADMAAAAQAFQMAQYAQKNAAAMAPPPVFIPPPPGTVRFGQSGNPGSPSVSSGTPNNPMDYGNPSEGETFGALNQGHIENGMAPGKMGAPNIFKSAKSGVSGGGGGASASGGGGGKGGGKGGGRSGGGGKRNTASGEIKFGGPKAFAGGDKGGDGAGAANPFADALAKLFPQDQNGKTVVDARQIASGAEALSEEDMQLNEVTSSDLTIFEQITAKYRQMDGSGRF